MKRLAATIVAFAFMAGAAHAQGLVTTTPFQATTVITSGSVTSTNTFQQAIAASATRKGCFLQNISGNTMYVYVGTITSATTPSSLQLATKGTFNCTFGGIVATDAINVTGTAGDGYVVIRQ